MHPFIRILSKEIDKEIFREVIHEAGIDKSSASPLVDSRGKSARVVLLMEVKEARAYCEIVLKIKCDLLDILKS